MIDENNSAMQVINMIFFMFLCCIFPFICTLIDLMDAGVFMISLNSFSKRLINGSII